MEKKAKYLSARSRMSVSQLNDTIINNWRCILYSRISKVMTYIAVLLTLCLLVHTQINHPQHGVNDRMMSVIESVYMYTEIFFYKYCVVNEFYITW